MCTLLSRIHVVAPLVVVWLAGCDPGARSTPVAGAASAAATSSAAPGAVTRASIAIDDAHNIMNKGEPYSIAPCTELVLDGSGYVFKSADAAAPGPPNAVHVVHGSATYYRASFAGKWPLPLNAASLDPVKGEAFAGFEAGEPYIVAVGAETTASDGAMRFVPAWTTKVTVTPP